MIFKYGGTTIRLFSTKLFILITLGVCAIFAVLALHEMITANPLNYTPPNRDVGSNLHNLNILPTTLRHENTFKTSSIDGSIRNTAANENINKNLPQGRITETVNFIRPTVTVENHIHIASPEIEKLRKMVKILNDKEYVRNTEKFGTDFSQSTIVIIVQVHDRVNYFSHLLKSLSRAKGIEHALLIISNDYYSEEINQKVESVDFCRVLQIFFPFSYQLYPKQFPGTDPNDCPRDITKDKAKEIGCNNAETPDMFGHYREAKYTMTKHHWWWKVNKVFDQLNVTKSYVGPVLFLEEDYYVSPDFYHMLNLLYGNKMNGCKDDCDFITLGTYKSVDNYGGAENVALLSNWHSHEHNMGLAFDRTTWEKLKKCSEVFCKSYDEYNWDWSLMKISISCLPRPLKSLVLKAPRVFHLGECGLHHKKTDCNIEATVQKYQSIIDRNTENFYPSTVNVQPGNTGETSKFGPNGGWGDTRDHALCFQLMQNR